MTEQLLLFEESDENKNIDWINIKDRLPDLYDFVLVLAINKGTNEPCPVSIARIIDEIGTWDFLGNLNLGAYMDLEYKIESQDITHWKPIMTSYCLKMEKYNIFRQILKDLKPGKVEVIPDDPKNKECAEQMTSMINLKIVKSRSDSHPEYGYPMGEILCRNLTEAKEHIEKSEFNDCYIINYMEKGVEMTFKNDTLLNEIIHNISKCEHYLDLILTQTDSISGFCSYYPSECLEKLKIMKSILKMELKK